MMAAPDYYQNEEFLKWFDFEKNEFKEGTPIAVIEMVRTEDAHREAIIAEKLRKGIVV